MSVPPFRASYNAESSDWIVLEAADKVDYVRGHYPTELAAREAVLKHYTEYRKTNPNPYPIEEIGGPPTSQRYWSPERRLPKRRFPWKWACHCGKRFRTSTDLHEHTIEKDH